MVQGEKSNMLATSSCIARTSDPFARKAGFEAVQRMDKQMMMMGSNKIKETPAAVTPAQNYGSWGPVFQNKQNFASMHFC